MNKLFREEYHEFCKIAIKQDEETFLVGSPRNIINAINNAHESLNSGHF